MAINIFLNGNHTNQTIKIFITTNSGPLDTAGVIMLFVDNVPAWMLKSETNAAKLPPWSTMLTRHGVLATGIAMVGDSWYGWAGYVVKPSLSAKQTTHFAQQDWIKIFSLPFPEFHQILGSIASKMLVPQLGKLVRIPLQDITHAISAQDEKLIAAFLPVIEPVANTLGIGVEQFGLCGSMLYKTNAAQNDVDFVIYGHSAAQKAWPRVQRLATLTGPCIINGRHYHARFRVPGSNRWFDPHFYSQETYTSTIVTEGLQTIVKSPIRHARIVNASQGMLMPARYLLEDGSSLISYRLGHIGLWQYGDHISSPPLPTIRIQGKMARLVLQHEHLVVS